MQIDIPDSVIDALRDALTPVLDRLIEERVEQRRPLLLSVTQVAEELSCSRASVYGLIHGGHLEAVRTGRSYHVATATLHEYVAELTKPSYQRDVVRARRRTNRAIRETFALVTASRCRDLSRGEPLAPEPGQYGRSVRLRELPRVGPDRRLRRSSFLPLGRLARPVRGRRERGPKRRSPRLAAP